MEVHPCDGREGRLVQLDAPTWEPLVDAVGMHLAGGFMWMQEDELENGVRVQAYKHIHTRRYLYLDSAGRAYEISACGRFASLRLDFAIQRALCTWWLLCGWKQADVDAISEACERARGPV